MKSRTMIFSALLLPAFLAGCVGAGPNAQQGVATGTVLGAIAGAVIGNNSRGHDSVGGAMLGAIGGAIAGGVIGNNVDVQQGTTGYPGYPDDRGYRRVRTQQLPQQQQPPPAPLTETVTPPPAPNAIWIPGFWSFDGRGYAWVNGAWEIPPPNAHAYVAAHWESQGGRNVYVPGGWR